MCVCHMSLKDLLTYLLPAEPSSSDRRNPRVLVKKYPTDSTSTNNNSRRTNAGINNFSVGIDLKELGVRLPKCLKFCPGIEI